MLARLQNKTVDKFFLVSWQCHRKDRRKDFHTRTRT